MGKIRKVKRKNHLNGLILAKKEECIQIFCMNKLLCLKMGLYIFIQMKGKTVSEYEKQIYCQVT